MMIVILSFVFSFSKGALYVKSGPLTIAAGDLSPPLTTSDTNPSLLITEFKICFDFDRNYENTGIALSISFSNGCGSWLLYRTGATCSAPFFNLTTPICLSSTATAPLATSSQMYTGRDYQPYDLCYLNRNANANWRVYTACAPINLNYWSVSVNGALPPNTCGDGNAAGGEECDDGNNIDNDGCTSSCILEFCGDGITQTNEICDDSNSLNNDGCSSTCHQESCGDSI